MREFEECVHYKYLSSTYRKAFNKYRRLESIDVSEENQIFN
mgnify:CR=1 FL=1